MKKIFTLFICFLMVISLSACKSQSTYTPGTYTGSAQGFGGLVEVVVTVDDSKIKEVTINAEKETESIGQAAAESLVSVILDKQSSEFDGVAGASVTSAAVKEALQKALDAAMGKEAQGATLDMKDGTYTATAISYAEENGLAKPGTLNVEVVIEGNKISSINVVDYTDTDVIGGMAFPILADEIVASQSLAVDVVAGATVSSNAFIQAVKDCVNEAGGEASVSALAEVSIAKPEATSTNYDTDILVIGAGMAGLSAALEAAQQGANVILVERTMFILHLLPDLLAISLVQELMFKRLMVLKIHQQNLLKIFILYTKMKKHLMLIY